MDGHTHLDRQRRERGVCPGCDTLWDRQEARLVDAARYRQVIFQLDKMADKPKPEPSGLCTAIYDQPVAGDSSTTHTCNLPAGHRLPHLCPLCDQTWTGR